MAHFVFVLQIICRIFALARFNFLVCLYYMHFDQNWTKIYDFRIGSKLIISLICQMLVSKKLSPKQPLSEPLLFLQISQKHMVFQPQSWCSQIETSLAIWANLCQLEGFLPNILSPNHTPGVQSNRRRISVQTWGQNQAG